MMDDLVKQFMTSGTGQQVIQQLTGKGLTNKQAQDTVEVTAANAAQQIRSASGGGGGIGGILSGALGGLFGGGGSSGLPTQLVDTITKEVATRTGLSPDMAKMAVTAVLPKVIEFAKSTLAGKSPPESEVTAP